MDTLKRFGVSMEENLLKRFDSFIRKKNYKTRSEAIRDLIRELLVEEEWAEGGKDVAGAIILVYNHHKRELVDSLVDVQHDFHNIIISSQHVHLDHNMCLEVVTVKGNINKVSELESRLKSIKGVKHASLAKSTLGKEL